MKMKTSFGAWILGVYAAVLVKFFPTLCVKRYTKKSNKNAGKFLPGKEKELAAIKKLSLNGDALRARVWSKETRVELLQQHNFALISAIQSEEEFDAVVVAGTDNLILAALKVYMPTKAKMLSFVCTSDIFRLSVIVKELPSVFSGLKTWEILGVAKETPYKEAERWNLASALIEADSRWAVPFMREVNKISPRQRNEAALEVFKKAFKVAFKEKADMSDLMVVLSVINPEMYNTVCANYYYYKDFSPYFEVMFPQVVKYLDNSVDDIRVADFGAIDVNDENRWQKEAFGWLSIGYYQIGNPRILAVLISSWKAIEKKVSKRVLFQLCCRAAQGVTSVSLGMRLLKVLAPVYHPTLLKTMLSFEDVTNGVILSFFPFKETDLDIAQHALRVLAQNNAFPVHRFNELTPELQEIAKEEILISAQMAALERVSLQEVVSKLHLHPRVEVKLLEKAGCYLKYVQMYMERVKIAESSFAYLLSNELYSKIGDYKQATLLFGYAQKWGLTGSQYLAVMQSPIKCQAMFLVKFVTSKAAVAQE